MSKGHVIRGDELVTCYYTSDPQRDWPWLLGVFLPTQVRMARVDLAALARREAEPS